jgi:hypothetical protein
LQQTANFNHHHGNFKSQKLRGCEVWHASICGFVTSVGFLALIYLKIYCNSTNFKSNKKVHTAFYTRHIFVALKECKAASGFTPHLKWSS